MSFPISGMPVDSGHTPYLRVGMASPMLMRSRHLTVVNYSASLVSSASWSPLRFRCRSTPSTLARCCNLFLDEATSALDELSEAQLYRLLRAASWVPTVVSVGHRSTLRKIHDRLLDVTAFSPRHEQPQPFRNIFLGPPEVLAGPPLARKNHAQAEVDEPVLNL
jgi:hypothetical protein